MGKVQSVWGLKQVNKQENTDLAKKSSLDSPTPSRPARGGSGTPSKPVVAGGALVEAASCTTSKHVAKLLSPTISPSQSKNEADINCIKIRESGGKNLENNEQSSPPKEKLKNVIVTVEKHILSSDSKGDVKILPCEGERDREDKDRVSDAKKERSKCRGPLRASNADMEIIVSGQVAALENRKSHLLLDRQRRNSAQSVLRVRERLSPRKRKRIQGVRVSEADLDVITQQNRINKTNRSLKRKASEANVKIPTTRIPPSGKEPETRLRSAALRKKLAAVKLQQKAGRTCKMSLKRLVADKTREKQRKRLGTSSSCDSLIESNSQPVEIVDITGKTSDENSNTSERVLVAYCDIKMPILRLKRVQTGPAGSINLATCSTTTAQPQTEASLATPTLGPEPLREPTDPVEADNPDLEQHFNENVKPREKMQDNTRDNIEPRNATKLQKKSDEEEHNVRDAGETRDEVPDNEVNILVCHEDTEGDVETVDSEVMDVSQSTGECRVNLNWLAKSDLLSTSITRGDKVEVLLGNTEKESVNECNAGQIHVGLRVKHWDATTVDGIRPKRPCCCSRPAAKAAKGSIPVAMVSPMVKEPFQPAPDVREVTIVAPVFTEAVFNKDNDEAESKSEGASSPMGNEDSQSSENFSVNTNDVEISAVSAESELVIANPKRQRQGSSEERKKVVACVKAEGNRKGSDNRVESRSITSTTLKALSKAGKKTVEDDISTDVAAKNVPPIMSAAQERLAELEDWDLEAAKKRPNPVDIEQDVIDDVTILSFTSQEDLLTFPPQATGAADPTPLKDLVLRKTNDIKQVKGWRKKLAKFNFIPVPSGSVEEDMILASEEKTALAGTKPGPVPVDLPAPQKARRTKKLAFEARVMNKEYVQFALQALVLPELQVKVHKLELKADSVNVNAVVVPTCCPTSPQTTPIQSPEKRKRGRKPSRPSLVVPTPSPIVVPPETGVDMSAVANPPRRRRKRRLDQGPAPSKKVRLELGRLGVQYVEVEHETVDVVGADGDAKTSSEGGAGKNVGGCKEAFCQLGCVCDSLKASHVVEHCGRADCMFDCVCPPDRITRISPASSHKTLLTDAYLNQIEDEGKKNLSKNEKDFFQTVVKKGSEMVVMGEKKQRERRMPNRFRDSVFLVGAEFVSSEFAANPAVAAAAAAEGEERKLNPVQFFSNEYSMRSLKDMAAKSPPKSSSLNKVSRRAQQANEQATQNLISQKIHKVMQERKLLFKDLVAQEELRQGNELDLSIRNQEMIQVIRWVRLQRLLAEEQVAIRFLKRRLHSSIIVSKPQDAVATDITVDVRELKGQEDAPGLVNILFSESMSPTSYAILFCDGVKWELAANLEGQSKKKAPTKITPVPLSTVVPKPTDSTPTDATPTALPEAPEPAASSGPSEKQAEKCSPPVALNKISRPVPPPNQLAPPISRDRAAIARRTYRPYSVLTGKKVQTGPQATDNPPLAQGSPRPPSPATPVTSKHLMEAKRQLQLALERESLYFPKPLYAALQIGTLPGTTKKHCRMKLILPVTDRLFLQNNPSCDAKVTCLLPMVCQEDRWCIVALKGVVNGGLLMPGTNCPIPRKLMYEAALVAHQKRVRVTLPIKLQENEAAAQFMLEHFGIYAFPGINEHVFLGPFSTEFLSSMTELPRAVRLVPCITSQKTKEKETQAIVKHLLDQLLARVSRAVDGKHVTDLPKEDAVEGERVPEARLTNAKIVSLKVKELALAQRLEELKKISRTPSLTKIMGTTRVRTAKSAYGASSQTFSSQKAASEGSAAAEKDPGTTGNVRNVKRAVAEPQTYFIYVDLPGGLRKKIELELNVNGTVTARHPLNPEMRLGFTTVESARDWFLKYEGEKGKLVKKPGVATQVQKARATPQVEVAEEEEEEIVVECTPMNMVRDEEDSEDEALLDESEDSNDSEAVKENIGNLASVLAEDYVDVERVSEDEARANDPSRPSTSSGVSRGETGQITYSKSRRWVRSLSERARRKELTILQKNLNNVLSRTDLEGGKTSKVYLINKAKKTIDTLRTREDDLDKEEQTLKSLKQAYLKKLRQLCGDLGPETRAVVDIVMASCAAFQTRRVDMLMAVESSYNRQHNLLQPKVNPVPETKSSAQPSRKNSKKKFGPCSPPRVESPTSRPLKRSTRKPILSARAKTAASALQKRPGSLARGYARGSGRGRGRPPGRMAKPTTEEPDNDTLPLKQSSQKMTTFTYQPKDGKSKKLHTRRNPTPPPPASDPDEPEFLPMIASVHSLAGSDFSFDIDEVGEVEETGGIQLETASISGKDNASNAEVGEGSQSDSEAAETHEDDSRKAGFIKVSDFAKISVKQLQASVKNRIALYRTSNSASDTATSTTPVFKTPVVIARQGSTGNLHVKSASSTPSQQPPVLQRRVLLPKASASTSPAGDSTSSLKTVLMSVTSLGGDKTAVVKKGPGVVEFIKVPTKTFFQGHGSQLKLTSTQSVISCTKVASTTSTSKSGASQSPGTSSPSPAMSYIIPFKPSSALKGPVTSSTTSFRVSSASAVANGTTVVTKAMVPVSGTSVYVLPQTSTSGKPLHLKSVCSAPELQRILQSSSGKQIMVFRSKNGKLIPTSTVTTVKTSLSSSTSTSTSKARTPSEDPTIS